jgi:hypothetical protein
MANFFDQFDGAAPQAAAPAQSGNFFDQFDVSTPDTPGVKRIYIGGPPEQASPGMADTGIDALKSLGTGLAKGAIGLAGLPGDLSELGARGLDYATRGVGNLIGQDIAPRPAQEPLLGSGQIQNAVEGVTGKFYEPQTTTGNYAQTAGEFLPNMIGGPGSIATKLLTRVAAPALASEGAGQLTKGSALEPLARFGGAVLGGAGAAKLAAPARIAVPTTDALGNAATAAYQHPTVAALELNPSSMKFAASKITGGLNTKGFRELTAPQTYGLVKELETPLGTTGRVADIQSVRTALGKVAGNFNNPIEQAAANRAIRSIDDYHANLK